MRCKGIIIFACLFSGLVFFIPDKNVVIAHTEKEKGCLFGAALTV